VLNQKTRKTPEKDRPNTRKKLKHKKNTKTFLKHTKTIPEKYNPKTRTY
jgi:hypothetical protein